MKNKKINKFVSHEIKPNIGYAPLDAYEQELEEFLDKGVYESVGNLEETRLMFEEAAKNYPELREKKSITLRVNKEDLIKVKARSKRKNIPYQRIIGTLIHQYANDQIVLTI